MELPLLGLVPSLRLWLAVELGCLCHWCWRRGTGADLPARLGWTGGALVLLLLGAAELGRFLWEVVPPVAYAVPRSVFAIPVNSAVALRAAVGLVALCCAAVSWRSGLEPGMEPRRRQTSSVVFLSLAAVEAAALWSDAWAWHRAASLAAYWAAATPGVVCAAWYEAETWRASRKRQGPKHEQGRPS